MNREVVMPNMNITLLEMAAGKCWPLGVKGGPVEVHCAECGQGKRLHGVWKLFKWYCPFCVRKLRLTL